MYFLTLQRLLISSPGPQETVTHVLLNTFLFSLHEIDLVPSVFQFSPFCLQEHPILFRSLLMALNKYTFWDLTEQAVLFQTTSKAACSKHELVQSWDGACPAYSLWPFLIPNSLLFTTACMGRGPQPWPHTLSLWRAFWAPEAQATAQMTSESPGGVLAYLRAAQVTAVKSHVEKLWAR